MTAIDIWVAQLNRALAADEELIATVRVDQWEAPTPCPEWNVRELINHLVTGNLSVVALLRDQAAPDEAKDHLGNDPLTRYRRCCGELLSAFGDREVFDRFFFACPGPMPGAGLLHLRITEQLVHRWDLAQATGQSTQVLPGDLAETELHLSQTRLAQAPRTGQPFGTAQPTAPDASHLDRLVAYLGRS